MSRKAVILLSGGLDSTTCLYLAKKEGYSCNCLIFDYSQRHKKEINCAIRIANNLGVRYHTVKMELPWDTSSLTDKSKKIPFKRLADSVHHLPSTYVPGRNTIFISYAISYAETIKAQKIFIGANVIDFSGYPDCRAVYFDAWNSLLKALGTSIKIETPLLNLSKSQIIKLGLSLNVPYDLTWSCYSGGKTPCQRCDSCLLRAQGFSEAGIVDPLLDGKK